MSALKTCKAGKSNCEAGIPLSVLLLLHRYVVLGLEKFDWSLGTLINTSYSKLQMLIEVLSGRNPIHQ